LRRHGREDIMKAWHGLVVGIAGAVFMASAGAAAEITILTNQGVVSAVRDLAPVFERATGHKVIIQLRPTAAMMQKVNANAPADLVTSQPEVIEDFIQKGKVVAGSRSVFARAGIGVAVKAGAPKPDISTPEAFKRAMLAAKSIAYSQTASGVYVANLMERLGIAAQLKDKTKRVSGVPVAEVVAKGEAEIGLQQINVILPVVGADYAGPLPGELQDYVVFATGVLVVAKEPDAARAFARFAAAPENVALITKSGMERPAR
jgi:molybdate transport system substrate-binding protein